MRNKMYIQFRKQCRLANIIKLLSQQKHEIQIAHNKAQLKDINNFPIPEIYFLNTVEYLKDKHNKKWIAFESNPILI